MQYNTKDKFEYNLLDLMKIICAIFVVALHTSPLSSFKYNIIIDCMQSVYNVAVPFFFISSSYLFFSKLNRLQNIEEKYRFLNKYIKRLSIIYLFWTIYNSIFLNFRDGLPKNGLFLFQHFILGNNNGYLWFIIALIFSVLLVFWLKKYLETKQVLLISILFYIISLFLQPYYNIINKIIIINKLQEIYYYIFTSIRNGLFFGFFFVALGMYIANKDIVFEKSKYFFKFVACLIFMFFEVFIIKKLQLNEYGLSISIFLVPTTYYLIIICLNVSLKINFNYKFLRESSILMFLIGQTYIRGLDFLSRKLNIGVLNEGFIVFFITIFFSIITSIIIINISKNKNFKWLKLLY